MLGSRPKLFGWITTVALAAGGVFATAQSADFELPPAEELLEGVPDPAAGTEVEPRLSDALFPTGGLPRELAFLFPENQVLRQPAEWEPEWIEIAALPEFVDEAPVRLPAASALGLPPLGPLARMTIPVAGFAFEGNTAFRDEDLANVVAPFLAKGQLSTDDLESARIALTQHYIKDGKTNRAPGEEEEADDGYVNSGAVMPDQSPAENGGVVTFKIVEGTLTRVEIEWVDVDADGNSTPARGTLWNHYLKPRLRKGAGDPLHMGDLREGLQILQKNPNIKRLNAELKPDARLGESYLHVKAEPARPFHAGVDFHNERPPSVGSEQLEFWLEHTSLTGHSDRLGLRYGLFERGIEDGTLSGDSNFSVEYSLPVTRWDTLLDFAYSRDSYAVIEEPFVPLDLTGESENLRLGLRQPVIRNLKNDLTLGLHVERRRSETSLLGFPFSLTPGAIDGEIELGALRFSQEWVNRGEDHVFALYSAFSYGVDWFEPTQNGTDRDSEFFSWVGQAQFLRRFELPRSGYDFQAVARGNLQLANSPLLTPEQYSIGGANSVRGYRENSLVRDMGYFASLELQLPIWRSERGTPVLSIAPFVDVGGGWNHVDGAADSAHETIAGAGVGLLLNVRENLDASLYWGHAFTDFESAGDDDLQDHGVHFRVSWKAR